MSPSLSKFLAVHAKHFPEMIRRCPVFTTYTVHLMLDRARVASAVGEGSMAVMHVHEYLRET